jgi:N6-adenosine-specific RNA methylase IME4
MSQANDVTGKYQFLEPLLDEDFQALRADIAKRGVLVPVEKDENGDTLDGHHREAIAHELGLDCPTIVRHFATEEEKREHVIKLNLARRQLDPVRWGKAFRLLLDERGVRRGQGRQKAQQEKTATIAVLAAEVGVSARTARHRVKLAQDFDALPAAEKKKVLEKRTTVRGAARQAAKARAAAVIAAEPPPLPDGPFRVLVVDPPWRYEKRAGDLSQRGSAPYPSLSVQDICNLPVAKMAHQDAVLRMWATNAHLQEAFEVLGAWGFTYKTMLTWVKNRPGAGDWLRGQSEHCLLAVRGTPVVTLTNQSTVLHAPVREHSRKPQAFYDLVESLCHGSKVELFARETRKGWVAHGNEISRFTQGG